MLELFNVLIFLLMSSIHLLTRAERATKINSLLDDDLKFLESDSSLNVTLNSFPLFLLKLGHSFLK